MTLELSKDEFEICEPIWVTQEMINEYSHASGDLNPIHTHTEVAKAMGLERTIAHGMLLVGLIYKSVCSWKQLQNQLNEFRICGFETKFLSPIYSDSIIQVKAQVTSLGAQEVTVLIKILDSTQKATVNSVVRLQK